MISQGPESGAEGFRTRGCLAVGLRSSSPSIGEEEDSKVSEFTKEPRRTDQLVAQLHGLGSDSMVGAFLFGWV